MSVPTESSYWNQTTPAVPTDDQAIVFQSDGATPQDSRTAYAQRATSTLYGTVLLGAGLTAPALLSTGAPGTVGMEISGTAGGVATPAFVQGGKGTVNSGNIGVAFPANNTAGNCIVVVASDWAGAPSAVTDSQGNTYALAVSNPGTWFVSVWYALNIKAGANTVTATNSSGNTCQLTIHEYSGIALTGALLGSSSANGAVASLGTGSVSISQGALIFTAIAENAATTAGAAGFTVRESETGQYPVNITADQNQTAAGSYSATWTGLDGAYPSTAAIVAFAAELSSLQSADLLEFKDSVGSLLSSVNNDGQFVLPATAGAPANAPIAGAMAFDAAAKKLWVYTGSAWVGTVLS